MGNYFRLPDIDSFIQKVIVQGNCGFDISTRRKRINIIMIKLVILTLLFSVSFVPVFAPDKRNGQIIYSYKPLPGAEDAIYQKICK